MLSVAVIRAIDGALEEPDRQGISGKNFVARRRPPGSARDDDVPRPDDARCHQREHPDTARSPAPGRPMYDCRRQRIFLPGPRPHNCR